VLARDARPAATGRKTSRGRARSAARAAAHHGAWHLRDLKRLLELPANVAQLDFLETHPLIHPLDAYRIGLEGNLPQTHDPL
jgi:hypothetical protein